jgi:hypothetical protein
MLPDVASARATLDCLLLARIEERHIRFQARDGTLPADMPEANFLQKTDFVHGAETGMVVGGAIGLLCGVLLVLFPPDGLQVHIVMILATAIGGTLFGAWVSGMVAAALPNSRLKSFLDEVERGRVLLIADVPFGRVEEIEDLIARRHPASRFGGVEPHTPAFP